MLGWQIQIYRQTPGGRKRLAEWETSLGGIGWIDSLVKEGKAVCVAENQGYPIVYTAPAGVIALALAAGPPSYSGPPVIGDGYMKASGWIGAAHIDTAQLDACQRDEELTIEAWDLS